MIESEYFVAIGQPGPPFPLSICPLIDLALYKGSGNVFLHIGNSASERYPSSRFDKWPVKKFLLCFIYIIDTMQQKL